MRCIVVILAIAAAVTGVFASALWFKASRIKPNAPLIPDHAATKSLALTEAAMEAMEKSAELNRRAAAWTAVSVLLNMLTALLGALLD